MNNILYDFVCYRLFYMIIKLNVHILSEIILNEYMK